MINIYVVEDHNDVLEHIYKEIGNKRLKFTNLTLIHFDSHPDLGIPDLNAEYVFNKTELLDKLSIENWILPAVYANHINKIVWIKPQWAQQINVGKYNVIIGKHVTTGLIKVNSIETYFLSDNLYSNETQLVNKHEFSLYVCDFNSIINETDTNLLEIIDDPNQQLILDVDLDFFSTLDPFKRMFKTTDEFEVFKQVYRTRIPIFETDKQFENDYAQYLLEKKIQNEQIWSFLTSETETNNSNLSQLKELIKSNGIDAEILHNYGCCSDDCSLPDHISTLDEISTMMNQLTEFLVKYFMKMKPKCVTIARSSLDDYCPPDQVDSIQLETISRINSFLNTKISIKKCY